MVAINWPEVIRVRFASSLTSLARVERLTTATSGGTRKELAEIGNLLRRASRQLRTLVPDDPSRPSSRVSPVVRHSPSAVRLPELERGPPSLNAEVQ